MSYIVKGKDIPDCCYNCVHLDDSGDYPMCRITEEQRGYNFDSRNNKMDSCPLVEIPKQHSRLIEAPEEIYYGELYRYQPDDYAGMAECFAQQIREMPTILEAEVK